MSTTSSSGSEPRSGFGEAADTPEMPPIPDLPPDTRVAPAAQATEPPPAGDPVDAVRIDEPDVVLLLRQVAARMGGVSDSDALRRSLRTMLALYDAKAHGGTPLVRYDRDRMEQSVNLPGAS